jgi:hypothetical protein
VMVVVCVMGRGG